MEWVAKHLVDPDLNEMEMDRVRTAYYSENQTDHEQGREYYGLQQG